MNFAILPINGSRSVTPKKLMDEISEGRGDGGFAGEQLLEGRNAE